MSLKERVQELEAENARLKKALEEKGHLIQGDNAPSVNVPAELAALFEKMHAEVQKYFSGLVFNPSKASISVGDERYVLVRASALSFEFFDRIRTFYSDHGAEEADHITYQMLFDLGHLIGLEDSAVIHKKLKLKNPLEKLSAGPIHFAFAGWAFVEILSGSNPVAGKDFVLKYKHPFSFEADSWLKAGRKAPQPVCIMSAGYSSGWCEASFGIPLTAVEITCRAKGDEECCFIMAPPDQIQRYLRGITRKKSSKSLSNRIPGFLARKKMEEELKRSLKEKEILLKEVHHRVKNNLQIMSSLLRLQMGTLNNEQAIEKFRESEARINAMALLHEMLYRSGSLNNINIAEYLLSLVNYLKSFFAGSKNIEHVFKHQMFNPFISIDKAISCGLILNEIITNSFKHAFHNTAEPLVTVELCETPESEYRYLMKATDNGCGIPEDKMKPEAAGFGLQIIHTLTGQLDGRIDISNKNGTAITINFN
jgi:two-component sensor histidine kinase/predicted hydrocarbon binding protein